MMYLSDLSAGGFADGPDDAVGSFCLELPSVSPSHQHPSSHRRRSTTGARSIVAPRNVVVKADAKEAAEEVMADLTSGAEDLADKLTKYWEDSDEKPTLVAVGFGGLLALYFVSNLVNAVDRLPLISNVFELVGIIFSGWTAYRYFLVEGEKEKLTSDVKGFLSKVGVNL